MTEAQLRIASDLLLPADAVTETFAILGKRGSGKTNTAVVLVEEFLAARLPVCIVDPVGVWWGLRAGADGVSPGLPVTIVGGDHGDVPLVESAGAELAAFVVEEHAQLLLDLSHLRKGAQTRFMTDFAEALYHKKSTARTPLHLVIDEADAFAPQRTGPEGARLLGAIEDLIRRGRSRGIGMTCITQRPAVLNKNVLTQAEVLVVLKLTAPQDQAAIDDWVRANANESERRTVASLPAMAVGDAWFWSPGWLDVFKRVHVRARKTFDSSSTPKAGQKAAPAPRELASVDLEGLKKRIAATVEAAKEARAADPKALRDRVVELERTIAALRLEKSKPVEVVPLKVLAAIDALSAIVRDLEVACSDGVGDPRPLPKATNGARHETFELSKDATPWADAPPSRREAPTNGRALLAGAALPIAERKILTVLAQHPDGLSRVQIAILTGYSATSGGFAQNLAKLRAASHVEGDGSRMRATNAGLAALGPFEPLPRGKALLAYWEKNAGGPCERRILAELASVHPRTLTKAAVATRTGYQATSGGFAQAIARLRTLQLVKGRGELGLTPALAEEVSS